MRRWAWRTVSIGASTLILITLWHLGLLSDPAPSASAIPEIPFEKHVFANGLTVVLHEDRRVPAVAVNLSYRAGSRNEKADQGGLAHLVEHLMFEASRHSDQDFSRVVYQLGGKECNGSTGRDRTRYFMTVPLESLDAALWLESDRMGYLLESLTEEKLERARSIVIKEIQQRRNGSYDFADELLAEWSFPQGPYPHLPMGRVDDLRSISLSQVADWIRTYHRPSNAVLVIAGNIDTEKALEKAVTYFAGLPRGAPLSRDLEWVGRFRTHRRRQVFAQVPRPRLYMIWNLPGYSSSTIDYLDLLRHVLQDRIRQRFAKLSGEVTDLVIRLDSHELCGQLRIEAGPSQGLPLTEVESAIAQELEAIRRRGPGREEVESVQGQLAASLAEDFERPGKLRKKSDLLAISEVFTGDAGHYRKAWRRQQEAQAQDLKKAAQRWLTEPDFVLHLTPDENLAPQRGDVDRSRMPAVGAPDLPRLPLHHHVLANGLALLAAEDGQRSQTSWELRFRLAPGMYPSQGQWILEALLDREEPGQGSRTDLVPQVACDYSACVFRLRCSEDQMWDVLSALGQRLGAGKLAQARLVELRRRIPNLDDLREVDDYHWLARLLLPEIPTGGGEELAGLILGQTGLQENLRQAKALSREWLRPSNAALLMVGRFSPSELEPRAAAAFDRWVPVSTSFAEGETEVGPDGSKIYALDRAGSQGVIAGRLRLAHTELASRLAVDLLADIVNQRLKRRLESEKHWSYRASAKLAWRGREGVLYLFADLPSSRAALGIREVENLLHSVAAAGPLFEKEAEIMKTARRRRLAVSLETDKEILNFLSELVSSKIYPVRYSEFAEQLTSLSVDEVAKAASLLHFPQGRIQWLAVASRDGAEAGLKNLGREVAWIGSNNPIRIRTEDRWGQQRP